MAYDDVLKTSADAKVDGTTATTTESTNDQGARVVASLGLTLLNGLLDVGNQEILVLVAGDTRKRLIFTVVELPSPGQKSKSGTSEAGVLC